MQGGLELDDEDHQALDLLDGLTIVEPWLRAHTEGSPDAKAGLEGSIRAAGEQVEAVEVARDRVRAAYERLVAQVAFTVLEAARDLACTPSAAGLAQMDLAAIEVELNERPGHAAALPPAIEITATILGLRREGSAWAELLLLGESASAEASPALRAFAEVLVERVSASTRQDPAPARPLRVFRTALMRDGGIDLRARMLAADHPQHEGLARSLLAADARAQPRLSADELVARFDAARETGEAAGPDAGAPEPTMDGPKRTFTPVHLVLALIVLGLTIWHYWLR